MARSDNAKESFGSERAVGSHGPHGNRFGKAALVLVGEVLKLSCLNPRGDTQLNWFLLCRHVG